jgi:peptidoglycan/xylan/chitin deacetylase (PgdA/CDA1 family)
MKQKKKVVADHSIYLTFDDGPGTRLTPQILKILKENDDIKATFFLLGRNIPEREEIVKSIINAGHPIASHGFNHLNAWEVLPWKSISDIRMGWNALNTVLTVKEIKYAFRPPCGKMNLMSLLFLWIYKVPIIFWTIDCLDTWTDDHRDVNYAARRIQENKGGIVLFHDFDRTTDQMDDYVINSLDAVIKTGKNLGLNFSTIDKLYEKSV